MIGTNPKLEVFYDYSIQWSDLQYFIENYANNDDSIYFDDTNHLVVFSSEEGCGKTDFAFDERRIDIASKEACELLLYRLGRPFGGKNSDQLKHELEKITNEQYYREIHASPTSGSLPFDFRVHNPDKTQFIDVTFLGKLDCNYFNTQGDFPIFLKIDVGNGVIINGADFMSTERSWDKNR